MSYNDLKDVSKVLLSLSPITVFIPWTWKMSGMIDYVFHHFGVWIFMRFLTIWIYVKPEKFPLGHTFGFGKHTLNQKTVLASNQPPQIQATSHLLS